MSLILSGMINICQLVGACVVITILDKLGRRKLAIGGGIAMGVPHAILAGLVATYNTSWTENAGVAWFAVALVYIYVLMYSVTYGPLGWCLPAEVSCWTLHVYHYSPNIVRYERKLIQSIRSGQTQ